MPANNEISSTINDWINNAFRYGNLFAVMETYAEIISSAKVTAYQASEDYEARWTEMTSDSSPKSTD